MDLEWHEKQIASAIFEFRKAIAERDAKIEAMKEEFGKVMEFKPWMPLSCAFPKWMIYSELWCRNKYRYLQYRVGLLTGRYK